MKLFAMSVVALLGFGFGSPARAEVNEKILTEVYHQGLKSFYAGRYAEANETLSQAIDGGTKDPRPYYIRGITNLRLGRTAGAQADFQAGANIEGHDFDLFYNVSKALERIQGTERKMLESYRAAGRKNALAEVEKVRFQLYRRFNPGEGVVGAATTNSGAGGAAGQASAGTDPNAPAATGAAPANNPFGGGAPAPTAPTNPFGGGAPAAPPAAAPPGAAPPANPFGT